MQAGIPRSCPAEFELPHFDHEDSSLAAQRPRCEVVGISFPDLAVRRALATTGRFCCLRIWRPGAVSNLHSCRVAPWSSG